MAEAGTLMYKDSTVRMETVFGDGSVALSTGGFKVWIQSLPFSRLAGRMYSAASQRGGSRDEGSVLGGLGGLISGDRNF